jgi:hypothetical protein
VFQELFERTIKVDVNFSDILRVIKVYCALLKLTRGSSQVDVWVLCYEFVNFGAEKSLVSQNW